MKLARLKTLLKRVKPPEHGVIVRTAAESATEEALEADLRRLLAIWDQIQSKATRGKAPTVLYEEPELTVRVVRDLFTDEEYRGLVTDSQRVHGLVVAYLREVAPDLAEKVTLHKAHSRRSRPTGSSSRSTRRSIARCGCPRAATSSSSAPRP